MKLWTQLILLTFLDFIIIWFWVKQQDPDPSVSIGILIVVPLVIIINLIIAAILFRIKRQYAKAFLINSIISAIIMYNLFIAGIDRHQRLRYESWQFMQNDTTYRITHNKLDSTFDFSYSTNQGSSTSLLYGQVGYSGKNYILTNDTLRLIIKNNFLFGFQSNSDSIKLTQLE